MKLFLGNLPPDAREAELADTLRFHEVAVSGLRLILDRETGMCKGYGFVEVDTTENIEYFRELLRGVLYHNRVIRVEEAHIQQRGSDRRRRRASR